MTTSQVANHLGVSKRTIQRWCESGRLPAIAKGYGHKISFRVSREALEFFQVSQHPSCPKAPLKEPKTYQHSHYLKDWKLAMESGLMTGKPFSAHTVSQYQAYAEKFLVKYKSLSLRDLKAELLAIPPSQFGKKDKFFKAIVSLAKYLLEEEVLDGTFLKEAEKLRPKRHKPPKRIVVAEADFPKVMAACETSMDQALVILLASTGLRASECADLKTEDIDLLKQTLIVRKGKGNKTRQIGLTGQTVDVLNKYLGNRAQKMAQPLFLNSIGAAIDRHGIRHRLDRIGKLAGISVTAHALRRSFVTINANKGRPLQMLQMACGHSSIQTTRSYCLTSEDEVVRAMQDW